MSNKKFKKLKYIADTFRKEIFQGFAVIKIIQKIQDHIYNNLIKRLTCLKLVHMILDSILVRFKKTG